MISDTILTHNTPHSEAYINKCGCSCGLFSQLMFSPQNSEMCITVSQDVQFISISTVNSRKSTLDKLEPMDLPHVAVIGQTFY